MTTQELSGSILVVYMYSEYIVCLSVPFPSMDSRVAA